MTPAQREKSLIAIRNSRDISCFDIISIDDVSIDDISLILEIAEEMKKSGTEKLSLLKGKTIVNAFYENSTRTKMSFEMAGKHLGADTINMTGSSSSVKKGESLIDTTQTIAAYGAQAIVIRTNYSGIPDQLKTNIPCPIINAGDGIHEHPSQALLDVKTIIDHHGTIEGKIITIVGDILHSRVFGSLARIIHKLGGIIRVACPKTFLPEQGEKVFNFTHYTDIEKAVMGSDVVYVLRVQEERGSGGFIPSLREYSKTFGITDSRLSLASKNVILMHPGPVIRDIDMHSALVNLDDRSRVLDQVENGMAVRAAMQWLVVERYDGMVRDDLVVL